MSFGVHLFWSLSGTVTDLLLYQMEKYLFCLKPTAWPLLCVPLFFFFFLVKNKVHWCLIHLFPTIPVIMDVCQAPAVISSSDCAVLLYLVPVCLKSSMTQDVILTFFDAIAHSTISSERWPRVSFSLLPFCESESLLTAHRVCWLLRVACGPLRRAQFVAAGSVQMGT